MLAVAGMSLIVAGCSKSEGPTVAVVNGQPISQKDFYAFLERKQVVQVQTPQGVRQAPVAGTLGLQALQDLVNRRLLVQLAEKEGLLPTQADIDRELAFQTKRRPDFVSYLTSRGMTLDMIREDIQFDLARERLLTKGISVTTEDVDLYVKENPEEFMEPAQAQMLVVVVSDEEKKRQVDRDLQTGQNFQIVATRYSEAPRARELGGLFPESRLERMPKRLQDLVAKTPELKTTDWIKDGKNWLKFFVQKKSAAKPIKLDDVRKEYVRRQLAMQRGEKVNDLGKKLAANLRSAKVDVTASHLKGPWDKAFEQAKAELARTANADVVATKR